MTSRTADVLARIRSIPEGRVASYGDVSPGAPRFAGTVLAESLEPDIPWQRVVRADGTLAKGRRQAMLLREEGVPMRSSNPPRVDMAAARILPDPSVVGDVDPA